MAVGTLLTALAMAAPLQKTAVISLVTKEPVTHSQVARCLWLDNSKTTGKVVKLSETLKPLRSISVGKESTFLGTDHLGQPVILKKSLAGFLKFSSIQDGVYVEDGALTVSGHDTVRELPSMDNPFFGGGVSDQTVTKLVVDKTRGYQSVWTILDPRSEQFVFAACSKYVVEAGAFGGADSDKDYSLRVREFNLSEPRETTLPFKVGTVIHSIAPTSVKGILVFVVKEPPPPRPQTPFTLICHVYSPDETEALTLTLVDIEKGKILCDRKVNCKVGYQGFFPVDGGESMLIRVDELHLEKYSVKT